MKIIIFFAIIFFLSACKTAKVESYTAQTLKLDSAQKLTLSEKYNFIIVKETVTVTEKDSFDRITKKTQKVKTTSLHKEQFYNEKINQKKSTTKTTAGRDTLQKVNLNSQKFTKSNGFAPNYLMISMIIITTLVLLFRISEH